MPQLTRAHRVLIGVVVAGAVIIAGIGFAGSYSAVRELAVKKGFGTFAYVFPIGIDAGICVLLALDLLLTWIRIPFPLLRQTAWLLTAATIAFNGAAAWPDPLGVGMHAVIPVLFVVAVEAARHAIGRIADITADKHMEGVRLTRWLLSPIPTFLLWRRMKLWELRSYDQVIKLEQERLVYQASLRSRFGRAWRRKAPVESLMPLRLARYGVPLAKTAPAGLAAAGIDEPPIQFTIERTPVPTQRQSPELEAAVDEEKAPAPVDSADPQPDAQEPAPHPQGADVLEDDRNAQLADAYHDWMTAFGFEPTTTQFALWLRDQYGIATTAGGPLPNEQLEPLLRILKQRHTPSADDGTEPQAPHDTDDGWADYFYNAWLTYAQEHGAHPDAAALATYLYERDQITGGDGQPITGADLEGFVATFRQHEFDETEPHPGDEAAVPAARVPSVDPLTNEESAEAPVGGGAHAAKEQRSPRVSAAIDDPPGEDDTTAEPAALTTVDRYYLAWMEYQTEHGQEPKAEQLSAYLAERKGMTGRGGKPVSPSTLRRYLLPFRVYNLWAEQRVRNESPSLDAIAQQCAAHGITAQHNKPLTTDYVAEQAVDFERRWQALTRHHAQPQQ
ncbi:DUF2637 domain-containing protein [Streptomyces mexicanus]|jgi:hypothetical protein|uniref:DUF2637 domain-containing protein n=1 Tax=Streptomyces mexicanus TaxID=178566 RepID=UPI001F3A411B|nr:DUF2637 domain-containing protein [Streptomyces mexicanus]